MKRWSLFFLSASNSHSVFLSVFQRLGCQLLRCCIINWIQGKWWNKSFCKSIYVWLLLYFIIQAIALVYTRNMDKGMEIFQTNLGLLVLPVAVFYCDLVNRESWGRLMKWYTSILFIVTVIALAPCRLFVYPDRQNCCVLLSSTGYNLFKPCHSVFRPGFCRNPFPD